MLDVFDSLDPETPAAIVADWCDDHGRPEDARRIRDTLDSLEDRIARYRDAGRSVEVQGIPYATRGGDNSSGYVRVRVVVDGQVKRWWCEIGQRKWNSGR